MLDFCSISDRSVSSGRDFGPPWVSITALASLGAVEQTLRSKETLLHDMEKKNLRDISFPMLERKARIPSYISQT